MEVPLGGKLAIVAATAGAFFALGAYYQHQHVICNIRKLEQRNPHAYFIRRKLYGLLDIFNVKEIKQPGYDDIVDDNTHKMGAIMKYGFPSMNEICLNETFNFVTAFDRRNSAIQWMCERVDELTYTNAEDYGNHCVSVRNTHRSGISYQQSEPARVFFMSNIKPFLSRGFNTSIWERLLHYVHDMAQHFGTVYVYTGSIYLPRQMRCTSWFLEFQPEDNTIVAIPTHFFKIIIIDPKLVNSAPYAEAYVVPNSSSLNDDTQLRSLLCDVRDIENSTGLKFFEGLDRNFVDAQVAQNLETSTSPISD
ncbi:endonuclease G, mitochondrial [Drosophila grimshawi]|uniref:GH12970 n=1 Tax=Drosophila grimshawi TaxID=7222 RepID=B4K352_DROGR|nr:endonuclease G, mitochondrial [Drosophila grimshawi]EDW04594.1 GH12970 [Drosophila grimshawi]